MPPKHDSPAGNEEEHASDVAEADAARVTAALGAIHGAWERTQEGLDQAASGEGTPIDKLG